MDYAAPVTPQFETLLPWLDLAGLTVFAASGALAAARKRLDFVGACFFALITATGGGTLRDVLIGAPIFWMRDATPVLLCVGVAIAAWAIPLRWWPERALEWFDAAGLAAYAVYGAGKAPAMMGGKENIGFEAEATIKRSDFGISYGIPMVSDEVKLDIAVAFQK